MIQRLDQSCSKSDLQNNYSYELLKKYKNKKVVADYSEFMMMNQISWLRGKVAVACDIALARNTLEGMRFIQATRPLSSFSHRNTDLSIATALSDSSFSETFFSTKVTSSDTPTLSAICIVL